PPAGYVCEHTLFNVAPQPLDFYSSAILKMRHDFIDKAEPKQQRGVLKEIGILSGRRVYSVTYPAGLLVFLIERQEDMFLPLLYVSSSEKVAELKVTRIDGQEVFFY